MFGTGVIVAVAFIHMLSPADKILSGEDAPTFFQEEYDSFSGVFAVLGIIVGHGIQILVKEYFKKTSKVSGSNQSHISDSSTIKNDYQIITTPSSTRYSDLKGRKNNNNSTEMNSDTQHIFNENHINIDDSTHQTGFMNTSEQDCLLSNSQTTSINLQDSNSTSHYHENGEIHNDSCHGHDGCGGDILFLYNKKQVVSYLLEIGISMHSVLIGFTFGTNFDEELHLLLIALMFHQFFEGIALSTVFIEARFKNYLAPLIMVILYCSTMPLGGIFGLIVHNLINDNAVVLACVQGILDSVAAGLLIYDAIVNILYSYTSSSKWDDLSSWSKVIQISSFYLGCIAMAVIGIWA